MKNTSATLTAGVKVVLIEGGKDTTVGYLNASLTIFVITCVCTLLFWSAARWLTVWFGWDKVPTANGGAQT